MMLTRITGALRKLDLPLVIQHLKLAKSRVDVKRGIQLVLRPDVQTVHFMQYFTCGNAHRFRRRAGNNGEYAQAAFIVHIERTVGRLPKVTDDNQSFMQQQCAKRSNKCKRSPEYCAGGESRQYKPVDQQTLRGAAHLRCR